MDGIVKQNVAGRFEAKTKRRVLYKKSGQASERAWRFDKIISYCDGFVDNELFISEKMYAEYSKKYGIPQPEDMLVTGVDTLGICYVVKQNDKFYFKDGNIIWLKKKSDVLSNFIEYAFIDARIDF